MSGHRVGDRGDSAHGIIIQKSGRYRNVIYDLALAQAMADGILKEQAVITEKNVNRGQHNAVELEQINPKAGVLLHENTKVELEGMRDQQGS